MAAERTDSSDTGDHICSGTLLGRLRKIIIAAFLAVVVLLVDLAVLRWIVPWAHEHYQTIYGSGGYVVVFFMVFLTVIASLALMTYVFQHESYPSDKWQ